MSNKKISGDRIKSYLVKKIIRYNM